jgi:eukaryotic-like serine/threonine-protein kinase
VADELVGGRYRLRARLGAGGMSEVWVADDEELGRDVALKLLAPDADPARFEREARAVATLAHPNICRLYDYGKAAGRPFMVLEYLAGGTLEDRLVPGESYPDKETARIAGELAGGLAHAHERGLVHRDLKPANVLFDDEGRAKISDFGIARLRGSSTLTETGTLLGTAAYISPEQAQGLTASAASDVYSFGVILYRLLTGRLPFEADSPIELARMHIHERPVPFGEARPDAPSGLAALAEAALAKDPRARPANGAALVEALSSSRPTLAGRPTIAAGSGSEPTLVIPRARRGGRGWRSIPLPLVLGALLLLLIGAAGAAVALVTGGSNSSKPTASSASQRTRKARTTGPIASNSPSTARTSTRASTRRATTRPTTISPPPTPPPPAPPPTPPPPTLPPPPTTLPTTVTIPLTTGLQPPPPSP